MTIKIYLLILKKSRSIHSIVDPMADASKKLATPLEIVKPLKSIEIMVSMIVIYKYISAYQFFLFIIKIKVQSIFPTK